MKRTRIAAPDREARRGQRCALYNIEQLQKSGWDAVRVIIAKSEGLSYLRTG